MIVATAGHVDHGKTSLVKHLTGVDTDRLAEEKRRGLSIDLGFAYRKLEGCQPIGFVDVPGHTRFINTMIAGVRGIDLGMLVVAADDGPMPQTFEHLDVLRLLGVARFLLVVTKIDRVPAGRVQEVAAQTRGLLQEENNEAPLFAVSNTTGEGVAPLLEYLQQCARSLSARAVAGGFRLSIDRAFNLKGVGLVVTGTATAGSVSVGDSLVLQPAATTLRVRGIHVQDEQAVTACAGQRCALNIVGDVARDDVARGDWLVDVDAGPTSTCFDARVQMLPAAPCAVRHRSPVKVYLGARRVAGRLFILEGGARLAPGASALVQLLLDEPVSCCHGELFLLRDDSESFTLGGGTVLDPYAPRAGKSRPQRLDCVRALDTTSPADALHRLVVEQGRLLELERFRQSWNLREPEMAALCTSPLQRISFDGVSYLVSLARWQHGLATLPRLLHSWHRQHPLAAGMPVQQLKSTLADTFEAPLLAATLKKLQQDALLRLKDGALSLPGFRASVSDDDVQRWNRIEDFLQRRGNSIPLLSQVVSATGLEKDIVHKLVHAAVADGRLHKLTDNRYATPSQLAQLAQLVRELLAGSEAVTVVSFKGRMGTGRKVAIDVLEYFDRIGFTRRDDEIRVIVDAELPGRMFSG